MLLDTPFDPLNSFWDSLTDPVTLLNYYKLNFKKSEIIGGCLIDQATNRLKLGGCLINQAATVVKPGNCLIDQAATRLNSGSCLIDQAAARIKSGSFLIDQDPGLWEVYFGHLIVPLSPLNCIKLPAFKSVT